MGQQNRCANPASHLAARGIGRRLVALHISRRVRRRINGPHKMVQSRNWGTKLRHIREQVANNGSWLVALSPDEVEDLESLGYRVNINQTGEPEEGKRFCTVTDG